MTDTNYSPVVSAFSLVKGEKNKEFGNDSSRKSNCAKKSFKTKENFYQGENVLYIVLMEDILLESLLWMVVVYH